MAVRSLLRPRTAWLVSLAAALVLATAPAVSAGGAPIGVDVGSGKHGPFGYVESEASPAGTCRFGYVPEGEDTPYNGVRKVTVEPPRARARAGRSSQRIAWRLVVQAYPHSGPNWVYVDSTDWQSKRATPSQRAAFTRRGLLIDSKPFHEVYGAYRAMVQLRWFASDDRTVVGKAWLFPDHYAGVENGTQFQSFDNHCGATTG